MRDNDKPPVIRLGAFYNSVDNVLIRSGTPAGCYNLTNRSWRPLLNRAGLPTIPFHNLRHTSCATLLPLSKRAHPKLV